MSTEKKTPYEAFLAKQQARKEAALARIKKASQKLDKETSAKYVPDNLKIIANYTVGNVQEVSNVKDVAVVKSEDGNVTKKPAMYLYAEQANDVQVVTTADMVTAPAIKVDGEGAKYVLNANYAVYASAGDPNKLILVTDKENVNKYDIDGKLNEDGLKVIAHQIAPVQFLSDASDVDGKTVSMSLWATVSNDVQVVTAQDDVSYILVKSEEDEKEVEKYVLTDNFDVYNQMGEPNKLIVITEKDEVLNVPVVKEETVEESTESTESTNSISSESSEEIPVE